MGTTDTGSKQGLFSFAEDVSSVVSAGEIVVRVMQNRESLLSIWKRVQPYIAMIESDPSLVSDIAKAFKAIFPQSGASSIPRDARWVQTSLNIVMGTKIVVDGDIGEETKTVVKQFQSKNGLSPDGWVGPQTLAVLDAIVSSRRN